MKRFAASLLMGLLFALSGKAAIAAGHPPVNAQVTFLYYADLAPAAAFYETTLGLKKTYDQDWVKFYQITPTSYVGLVDEKKGHHKSAEGKAVMVSMETLQLEAWYERMRAQKADFISHFDPAGKHPLVNGFMVRDPGGYTVEFFRWKK